MAEALGGILDTSFFIAREQGRPINLVTLPDGLAVSVVTLAELRVAVLNETDRRRQARRLDTLERALRVRPVPIDEVIAFHWAALGSAARSQSNSRVNDLWIAATALAWGVPVVTQDEGFRRLEKIGGPRVVIL